MSQVKDITGQKFGRLTAVKYVGPGPNGKSIFQFRCDCGELLITAGRYVKLGKTRSCGCLQKELTVIRSTTHGKCYSREYYSWQHLKDRCYNKNNKDYKNYGGRGVTVCDRWLETFENFFADMGRCPEGFSLDRENNDKGYGPDNCRWADKFTQGNNTRRNKFIVYDGERLTCAQWSRRLGGNPTLVTSRIWSGWTEEQAVSLPLGTKLV